MYTSLYGRMDEAKSGSEPLQKTKGMPVGNRCGTYVPSVRAVEYIVYVSYM